MEQKTFDFESMINDIAKDVLEKDVLENPVFSFILLML